jgi:hypothetical protein
MNPQFIRKENRMMQEKTVQIHFRATEREKILYARNAQKCGLSLSEYIRKLAGGYEPKALPPINYPKLIEVLSNFHNLYRYRGNDDAAAKALLLITCLTEEISPRKRGNADGNDQDMAGAG